MKLARLDAGLSQTDVARDVAVSQQTVSNWEEKGVIPDGKYYDRLAEVLRVDLVEFLRWIADAHRQRGDRKAREARDVRNDHAAAMAEMRQIVEDNRDINARIGQDVAALRVEIREILTAILQKLEGGPEKP